jgi:hypothetical protein
MVFGDLYSHMHMNAAHLPVVATYCFYAFLRIYGVYHERMFDPNHSDSMSDMLQTYGLARWAWTAWPLSHVSCSLGKLLPY